MAYRLLESGDQRLLESGSFRLLEEVEVLGAILAGPIVRGRDAAVALGRDPRVAYGREASA